MEDSDLVQPDDGEENTQNDVIYSSYRYSDTPSHREQYWQAYKLQQRVEEREELPSIQMNYARDCDPQGFFRLSLINDLMSHAFQWLPVRDIAALANTCIRLAHLLVRCRLTPSVHDVSAGQLCKSLAIYEGKYDELLNRLHSTNPHSVLISGSMSERIGEDNPQQLPIIKSTSSSSSSSASSSSSCSSSSSSPSNGSSSIRCAAHTKFCLRSLRLGGLTNIEAGARLVFLRYHLTHFHQILRLSFLSAQQIYLSDLPRDLQDLNLGNVQELKGNAFPSQLRRLCLQDSFRGTLSFGSLPQTLEVLEKFPNQHVHRDFLPNSLRVLTFCDAFDKKIFPGCLPPSLCRIEFGTHFDSIIEPGVLPGGLQVCRLGGKFSRDLAPGIFPASLRSLRLSNFYYKPLLKGHLNDQLTDLDLGGQFNEEIPVGVLPPALKTLQLSVHFCLNLLPGALPAGLKTLKIWVDHFPLACLLVPGVLPPTLDSVLFFGKAEGLISEFLNSGELEKAFPKLKIQVVERQYSIPSGLDP